MRCASTLLRVATLSLSLLGPRSQARGEDAADSQLSARVEDATVQVFATLCEPDPLRPWMRNPPHEVRGTGVVIEGKAILTSAHLVLYACQIEVQANHSGDKLTAHAGAIAPGIDLALLRLEDARFFELHPPLPRGSALPAVKDAVMVYGYPTGGTTLSITKGIVSRIEFATYSYPVSGLRVQVDAPINPGNSGGPAIAGDKMVGLVFSHLGGAQNVGYIIPCEEIELFLADVADGHYDGKPMLDFEAQTLENDALRAFLKVDASVKGVVVHSIPALDRETPLRQWDVVTRIGDSPIDDQGRIEIEGGQRVAFRYMVQRLATQGKVPLTVWRGGKELALQVPVGSPPRVVRDLAGAYPPYFIYGPVVFSAVTAQSLAAQGKSSPLTFLGSPAVTKMMDRPSFPGEELVMITSPLFPHKLSKGYGSPAGRVVVAVNKTPVRNLVHLVELLRDCRDDFVVLSLAGHFSEDLVLPRKEAVAATEAILTDNGIRAQGSPELLRTWSGGK